MKHLPRGVSAISSKKTCENLTSLSATSMNKYKVFILDCSLVWSRSGASTPATRIDYK